MPPVHRPIGHATEARMTSACSYPSAPHTHAQIAGILNTRGLTSGEGRPFHRLIIRNWGAPKLPDSPSNRMDVWKGEVIASTEEELLTGIQG